jgi:transposase
MASSYSQDLRNRVIDAVEKEGMSRRAAALRFGVSESSAIKWVRRWRLMGSRAPAGTGGHRPSALKPHAEFLKQVLAEKPDITLKAIAKRLLAARSVKADTSMLSRFFRREGITFKKRLWSPASKIGRTSAVTVRVGANIKA